MDCCLYVDVDHNNNKREEGNYFNCQEQQEQGCKLHHLDVEWMDKRRRTGALPTSSEMFAICVFLREEN